MRILGPQADLSGTSSNTNVRIINGVMEIWDTTTEEWRQVWFADGQLQAGEGIAP